MLSPTLTPDKIRTDSASIRFVPETSMREIVAAPAVPTTHIVPIKEIIFFLFILIQPKNPSNIVPHGQQH